MLRFLTGIVFILVGCNAITQKAAYPYLEIVDPISIQVNNVNGATFNWMAVQQNTATVFIFISPECPLCENYSLTFKQMMATYKADGVKLIGIVPGRYYTAKQVRAFLKQYQIQDMEVLMDVDYAFCNYFDAQVTPEVFVVNANNETVYEGKIDNWIHALGVKRSVVNEFFLEDAINALVNNKLINIKKTEAIGCIIE